MGIADVLFGGNAMKLTTYSSWLLFLIALVAAGLAGTSRCQAENVGAADDVNEAERSIIKLAESDPVGLLQLVLKNYDAKIKDYTGTFYKTERLRGKLGKEQVIQFKFKDKPFSVFMKWEKNAGGADKLLYVKGQNDNQMVVHPTGLLWWIRSVRRDPNGPDAMKATLNPCTAFGVANMTRRMLKVYEEAKKTGDLTTKYLGLSKVDGRKCVKMERLLPAKKEYPHARIIVQIDLGYLVPVALECYDWDGKLVSRYMYTDLKFNVGLKEKDFTPKANGL
jgi:hypothetical protein